MKVLSSALLAISLVFSAGITALGQQSARTTPKIDWERFRPTSSLLGLTVEQLRKEGYVVDFEKAEVHEFSKGFLAAFVPARNVHLARHAERGTLGLIVVFAKVPAPQNRVVSQVVRIDYAKLISSKEFEITGKKQKIDGTTVVADEGDPTVQLLVNNEGQVTQKINDLLAQTGEDLDIHCHENKLKAARERCNSYKEGSYADWLGCLASGWLWALQVCGIYAKSN